MKQILVAVALVMVGLVPGVSQAANFFIDDFTGETRGLNKGSGFSGTTNFTNWTVTNGTVDMIGYAAPPPSGFFNFSTLPQTLPNDGRYVDLDGSTNNAGDMTSISVFLGPGLYDLTFQIAGTQRDSVIDVPGSNDLTYGIDLNGNSVLDLGDVTGLISSLSVGTFDPFTVQTLPFSLVAPQSVKIIFSHSGGDKIGLILDNVSMDSRAAVPESASLMLLGAGLAAIGIWRRKVAR